MPYSARPRITGIRWPPAYAELVAEADAPPVSGLGVVRWETRVVVGGELPVR